MPAPSELSIARLAGILSQSKGATMKEVVEGLGVSRQTTTRWLTLMEKSGLLYKTQRASGKRGRPLGVYHPTERLSDFVKEHHFRSTVMLDFPVVSAVCRFNVKGICDLTGKSSEECGLETCPLFETHFF